MTRAQRREATPASTPAVDRGDALDVGGLPSYGFGTRSLMWWGTVAMCAIEGTAFAFMIVVYFYLRSLAHGWPAGGHAPDLGWGTINLGIILARSGRLEEAIDQFTKALQDDPGSAPIRENLRAAIEGRKRVPEPNPPGSR